MKYKIILILVILLIIPLANAQEIKESTFDAQKGYEWLLSKSKRGNYGDIQSTTMAALAYNQVNALDQAEGAARYLDSIKATINCWPKGICTTKETGLAILALYDLNYDTASSEEWLTKSQTAGLTSGWFLEVVSPQEGSCLISYQKAGQEITKNITVREDWIDLNRALEPNLLNQNPGLQLNIDCSSLGTNVVLALIYQSANSYYLVENIPGSTATITVNNGCFGLTEKSPCNYDSTLYANWALTKTLNPINSKTYLRDKYTLTTLNSALLFIITKDPLYASDLIQRQQKISGSWDNNIFNTAMALIALSEDPSSYSEEISSGTSWLESKQLADGSFNNNILETATALYALALTETLSVDLPLCTDQIQNGDEQGVDCGGSCLDQCGDFVEGCGDGDCDELAGEDTENCPQDCEETTRCTQEFESCTTFDGCLGICNDFLECIKDDPSCPEEETYICGDSFCDYSLGESSSNCPDDCEAEEESFCGDGYCDGFEGEDSDNCPQDCKEERRGFPWLLILIIIIVLAGILFFFYRRRKAEAPPTSREEKKYNILINLFRKKPPKETKKMPEYTPFTSRLQQRGAPQQQTRPIYQRPITKPKREIKSQLDIELEKSLEEAKKLLKKKK